MNWEEIQLFSESWDFEAKAAQGRDGKILTFQALSSNLKESKLQPQRKFFYQCEFGCTSFLRSQIVASRMQNKVSGTTIRQGDFYRKAGVGAGPCARHGLKELGYGG